MTVRGGFLGLIASLGLAFPAHASADWGGVAKALGKTGALQADGVYRVGLPRSDLQVVVDGVQVKPALALGSWLAFRDMGDQAEVMGDLVLTQDEVNPVMSVLVQNGIEITALHNHLLRASPPPMYMHVEGRADALKLATALHNALARSGTPFPVAPAASSEAPDLDTGRLEAILGARGTANGGVYQFSIPRAETPRSHGQEVPPSMGSAVAINFQPIGQGRAAITGDFVLIASEVNPVIRALRDHGIEVTALHNHMLDDEPRLFFMHFWAVDDAGKLATGLRAALNHAKVAAR